MTESIRDGFFWRLDSEKSVQFETRPQWMLCVTLNGRQNQNPKACGVIWKSKENSKTGAM